MGLYAITIDIEAEESVWPRGRLQEDRTVKGGVVANRLMGNAVEPRHQDCTPTYWGPRFPDDGRDEAACRGEENRREGLWGPLPRENGVWLRSGGGGGDPAEAQRRMLRASTTCSAGRSWQA